MEHEIHSPLARAGRNIFRCCCCCHTKQYTYDSYVYAIDSTSIYSVDEIIFYNTRVEREYSVCGGGRDNGDGSGGGGGRQASALFHAIVHTINERKWFSYILYETFHMQPIIAHSTYSALLYSSLQYTQCSLLSLSPPHGFTLNISSNGMDFSLSSLLSSSSLFCCCVSMFCTAHTAAATAVIAAATSTLLKYTRQWFLLYRQNEMKRKEETKRMERNERTEERRRKKKETDDDEETAAAAATNGICTHNFRTSSSSSSSAYNKCSGPCTSDRTRSVSVE